MANEISFSDMAMGVTEVDDDVSFRDMAMGITPKAKDLSYAFNYDAVSEPYRKSIEAAETKHGLPKGLWANMLKIESNFNPKAVGPKTKYGRAQGIAQLMTKFHEGVDPMDAEASIDYGAGYVKSLRDKFGDWDKAIAAYNAGPDLVENQYENLPDETRNYLEKLNNVRVASKTPSLNKGLERLTNKELGIPENTSLETAKSALLALRDTGVQIADAALGAAELATSLSTGAMSWLGGQIGGAMALPWGRKMADTIAEEAGKWAYPRGGQFMSKSAEDAMYYISKGIEIATTPGANADEVISKLSPEAGFLARFGVDWMTFSWLHMTGQSVSTGVRSTLRPEHKAKIIEANKELKDNIVIEKVQEAEAEPNPQIREAKLKAAEAEKIQNDLKHQEDLKQLEKEAAIQPEVTKQETEINRSETKTEVDVKPEEVVPEFEYETKAGHKIEKRGGAWYKDGVEITNEGTIKSAEGRLAKEKGAEKPKSLWEKVENAQDLNDTLGINEPTVTTMVEAYKNPNSPIWDRVIAIRENGKIIEGFHRASAAKKAGVEPPIVVLTEAQVSGLNAPQVDKLARSVYKKQVKEKGSEEVGLKIEQTKEPHQMTIEEMLAKNESSPEELVRGYHKRAVQEAIDAGERVPKKVREQYPDVKKTPVVTKKKVSRVDRQVGTEILDVGDTKSPFYQTYEGAGLLKGFFEKLSSEEIALDPEIKTQKLINDANRWARGDKDVDINVVRDELTKMSTEAENYLTRTTEDGKKLFIDEQSFEGWKDTVDKAANWVRKLDRSKIKQTPKLDELLELDITKEPSGPTLYDLGGATGEAFKQVYDKSVELLRSVPSVENLSKIARGILLEGKLKFEDFSVRMKEIVGDLWDNVKGFIKQAYDEAKKWKIFTDERGMVTWHGTKAMFDRFKNEFIGSGEGAQIKGWGHYFTSKREVGEWYAKNVGGDNLERSKILHEVKLPEDADWLDLDNPIPHDQVRKLLNYLDISDEKISSRSFETLINTLKGELSLHPDTRDFVRITGGEIQNLLTDVFGRRGASEVLLKSDIPGNTYIGGSSGERNYVVFDEKLPEIVGTTTLDMLGFQRMYEILFAKKAIKEKKGVPVIDKEKLSPEDRTIYEKGEEFNKAFEAAEEAKKFDLSRFLDRAGFQTERAIHERKGKLRRMLVDKYGEKGERMLRYIDANEASDGRSDRMYYEMTKEAFEDVPHSLTKEVSAVNLADRLHDIYGYKSASQFKAPKGMGPTETAVFRELIATYRKMTPEEVVKAKKASDVLFSHVKKWVDEMVRVGLKSPEEGELLKQHNYRKLRSIDVEKLYDTEYKKGLKIGDKIIRQTDSGIDTLANRAIKLIEPDWRILYKETANRIFRRVSNQEMKLEWKDFDAAHPDNPFVIFNENDRLASRVLRQRPQGWVTDFWYDNGKRKSMYYHPDVAIQLLATGPHMSYWLTKVMTNVLGVNLTRSMAVSASAFWAISRGITMDMAHTFFSARTFDSAAGKYKRMYSNIAPVYLGQIGSDMAGTFYDVMTRGEKTGIYEKSGGMMPFLAMREQHFLGRGIKPPGEYSKIMDGISFIGQSMEKWNRVAVTERSLKRMAKENGISLEQAWKDKELVMKAVHDAVERMPYRQGGWLTKEVDKLFGPFINASYQAGRTFLRGAKENPVDFWTRMSNIAIPTIGATIAMTAMAPEAKRDIPEWRHSSGPTITPFPDALNFIDEDGNKRWVTLTLPLDPVVCSFYNIFRGMTDKALYEAGVTDIEPDYASIIESITRALPTEAPMSPTVSAYLAYAKNIDIWREKNVVPEAFPYPMSRFEGQQDPNVGQLPKDIAKVTGLSGPRLQAAAQQLGMRNNEFAWALGSLYDKAMSDVDPRMRRQHWIMSASQIPGLKNVLGVTVPRAYRTGERKEMKEYDALESMIRRDKFDAIVEGYYWKGAGDEGDIDEFIGSYEEEHIRKSLEQKRDFVRNTATLPHRTSWSSIFHTTPEYKAKDFYRIWKSERSPEERDALEAEKDALMRAGYVGEESRDRFERVLSELQSGEAILKDDYSLEYPDRR
jgi:hypothetical protein